MATAHGGRCRVGCTRLPGHGDGPRGGGARSAVQADRAMATAHGGPTQGRLYRAYGPWRRPGGRCRVAGPRRRCRAIGPRRRSRATASQRRPWPIVGVRPVTQVPRPDRDAGPRVLRGPCPQVLWPVARDRAATSVPSDRATTMSRWRVVGVRARTQIPRPVPHVLDATSLRWTVLRVRAMTSVPQPVWSRLIGRRRGTAPPWTVLTRPHRHRSTSPIPRPVGPCVSPRPPRRATTTASIAERPSVAVRPASRRRPRPSRTGRYSDGRAYR